MLAHMISLLMLVGVPVISSPSSHDRLIIGEKESYDRSVVPVEFKNGQFGIILRDDTEGNPPSKEIPMDPNAKKPRPPIGGTEHVSISNSDPNQILQIGEHAVVSVTNDVEVGAIALSGHAEVRIDNGAKIAHIFMSGHTTLKISSGAEVSHLTTEGNSDSATVMVEERAGIGHITVAGRTALRLSGARVSHVTIQDHSTAQITGGTVGYLNLEGHSQAHIHGSTEKEAMPSGQREAFLGGGITYTPETHIYLYATGVAYRAGTISGTWLNGEYFSVPLRGVDIDNTSGERKRLSPQPTTLPTQIIIAAHIKPSFDCTKAVSRSEKMICGDPALAGLDLRLSRLYRLVLESSADAEQIKTSQRYWLRNIRDECTTAPCMRTAYERRIQNLAKMSNTP